MAENMSKNKYLKYFSIIKSKNVNDVMIQKCKRCYDTRQLTTNYRISQHRLHFYHSLEILFYYKS